MSSEFKEEFIVTSPAEDNQINYLIPSTSSDYCAANYSVSFDRFSWHEHVYRKLSNKPTPHYIENILGLQSKSSQDNQQDNNMIVHVTPPVSPQSTFSNIPPVVPTSEVNEPLNLSVKNEHRVRTKTVKDSSKKRKKPREPLDLKISTTPIHVVNQQIQLDSEPLAEDAEGKNKKKKARTTFTGRQIFELEKKFELKKNILAVVTDLKWRSYLMSRRRRITRYNSINRCMEIYSI
ncbi:hypothetical protein NQ317_009986 [Molorchus minor]|uniref:Homeobox domain-containing protein n=1 Tax=Molorchus minor TaxID=1323400 RepID=A0ABQ9K8B1_9CUCU|nr:hypothetical protein NQ317_009986 [Molorchus minor]